MFGWLIDLVNLQRDEPHNTDAACYEALEQELRATRDDCCRLQDKLNARVPAVTIPTNELLEAAIEEAFRGQIAKVFDTLIENSIADEAVNPRIGDDRKIRFRNGVRITVQAYNEAMDAIKGHQ